MEVYFMDALLYSKRMNNIWPEWKELTYQRYGAGVCSRETWDALKMHDTFALDQTSFRFYDDDGTTVGPNGALSDGAGNILLTGLDAGTYNQIILEKSI